MTDSTHSDPESISDKCSQPPLFEFEGFIVRPFDGWHLWVENPSGDGNDADKSEVV